MQCSVSMDGSMQNKKNLGPTTWAGVFFFPRESNGNEVEYAHLRRVSRLVQTAWRNQMCGNAKVDITSLRAVATVSQMTCTGVAPLATTPLMSVASVEPSSLTLTA